MPSLFIKCLEDALKHGRVSSAKAKEIRDYFATRLEEVRPVPPPVPVPAPVEDDTESDSDESAECLEFDHESEVASDDSELISEEEDEPSPVAQPPTPEVPTPTPLEEPPVAMVSGVDLQALIDRLHIDITQSYVGNWVKLEEILKSLV